MEESTDVWRRLWEWSCCGARRPRFFIAVVDAAMLWALRSSSRTLTGADTGFDLVRDRAKMSGHDPHLLRLLRLTASPC